MRGRNVGKIRGLSVAKCEVAVTQGQVGAPVLHWPVTEVQGGSVYPHDPGENLGLCKGGGGGPKKILMATVCRHK